MNQIFLTGRISEIENVETGKNLMVMNYTYEPDEAEYIPVSIDENTKSYIGCLRRGDLISIIGKIIFKDGELKIAAEKINYAG